MKTSKRVHRFLIDQEISNKIGDESEFTITDPEVKHQALNVLRLKEDNYVVLLDGCGKEFHGNFKTLSKKELTFVNRETKTFPEDNERKIHLVPSLLKHNNVELVLQKGTEIGVAAFHPIVSERTEKVNLKNERGQKIIREAVEQSGKVFVPDLDETKTLEEFLSDQIEKQGSDAKNIFALDFDSQPFKISEFKKMAGDIFILAGPEGGWGEKDLELFQRFGVERIALGSQTLRAETASIAASALVLLGE